MFDEEKLIEIVKPHILRCRPGDWAHAERTVKWVKELGAGREDLPLLITAGYIHDIGWRDLVNDKITFEELLRIEPQANANSETYLDEILSLLDLKIEDQDTVKRLVRAVDRHESHSEDEEIIVDADQLSKLCIEHLSDKYEKEEWEKMYKMLSQNLYKKIKTEKALSLYLKLFESLKQSMNSLN